MTTQQLELTEPTTDRQNWSRQSQRIYDHLKANPDMDISAPVLNQVGAGDGCYVGAFSKRISECRARLQSEGHDLILSKDERHLGQRRTSYKMVT